MPSSPPAKYIIPDFRLYLHVKPILMCVSIPDIWHLAGGCPEDCHIPYVMCPIPSGSLSMCGGTPRGQCITSSGQCSCNTGYSGVDCGSCALGYSREGRRCVLEGQYHCGHALLHVLFDVLVNPTHILSVLSLSLQSHEGQPVRLPLASLGDQQTLRFVLTGMIGSATWHAPSCLKLHHAMQNLLRHDDVLEQHELYQPPLPVISLVAAVTAALGCCLKPQRTTYAPLLQTPPPPPPQSAAAALCCTLLSTCCA